MTTTTVPDVDLEQWLAGEIEEPCGVTYGGMDCPLTAEWLVTFARECTCSSITQAFMCTPHKEMAESIRELDCEECRAVCRLTFTERIR